MKQLQGYQAIKQHYENLEKGIGDESEEGHV